jgi:glucose-6-phosphate isomerase
MTALPIRIDYALAMAEGLGSDHGLREDQLEAEAPAVERTVRRIQEEGSAGVVGFWGLPHDRTTLHAIDRWIQQHVSGITDVLVLGIGGSSLGARAVHQALGGPAELATSADVRLHFPDNSDPWLLSALLEQLDPSRTMALVISKSGGTVETAAHYLVVRKWLGEALGESQARHRLVMVTDPEKGPLRARARQQGIQAFEVPPNVGGRFSVLSAVGLLPARLAGYDVEGLLEGAASMADACSRPHLHENPAGLLAALHVLHHRLHGRGTHVLMPYADALRPFAAWYVQLWAESLGKRRDRHGRVVERGPTPIPAVGATDQHAQVQLFMEGPRDKLVTFVAVGSPASDLTIPHDEGDFDYLGGHSLAGVLDAERRGTTLALAEDGRPSITLQLRALDAHSLGALFFLYEAATAFAGDLYGVEAFDQPGVELGKRLASGLLGRGGYEQAGHEVRRAEAARPSRFRVG